MALFPDAIAPTTFDEIVVALLFFSANRSSRIIFSVKISYPFSKIPSVSIAFITFKLARIEFVPVADP
jgi:hypothetical protein